MVIKTFFLGFVLVCGASCFVLLLILSNWLDKTKINEQDAVFFVYKRVQQIAHSEGIPLKQFRGPEIQDSGDQKKYGHRWLVTYKTKEKHPFAISVVVTEEGFFESALCGRI